MRSLTSEIWLNNFELFYLVKLWPSRLLRKTSFILTLFQLNSIINLKLKNPR